MKIEEGKFYRSVEGHKVGPMIYRGKWLDWASASHEGKLWNVDGSRFFGHTEFVLIEEWRDEPEITVGSLWEFNNNSGFIVKVVYLDDAGRVVLRAQNKMFGYDEGELIVVNDYEKSSFPENYKPYVEKQKLFGYVAVVSVDGYNNGKPFFDSVASSEEEAKKLAEDFRGKILDIIKIEWKER